MELPAVGWRNKKGTAERSPVCTCGSWKNHWLNITNTDWPITCSVDGCNNAATDGAHIFHTDIPNERIVPLCNSCNQSADFINLKGGIKVSSANQEHCLAPKKPLRIP